MYRVFYTLRPAGKEGGKMKNEYVCKIIELLEQCESITILDLILQLLQKEQET